MQTAWIYQLHKPDLTKEAESRGISTEGLTVDQIRKLLVESVKTAEVFKTPEKPTSRAMEDDQDRGKTDRLNKAIREWNLSYRTTDNPVEFVERLEELIAASGVDEEDVLPALPRILQGKALLWYRNNAESWKSWGEFLQLFKLYYFPNNYEEDLIVKIVARKQKFRESFTDYVTDLQTLMRRYGNLSDKEKIHRIHENMQKEYKLYIKKNDYEDLNGLIRLAAEYEGITAPSENNIARDRPYYVPQTSNAYTHATQQQRSPPGYWGQPQSGSRHTAAERSSFQPRVNDTRETEADNGIARKIHPRYDKDTCCWSCGKPGHNAKECRSQRQIFCSGCGKLGVLSRNCCMSGSRGKRESLGAAGDHDREDNRLYVNATISGKEWVCLIDTGSTNTYMNKEAYEICKAQGAMEKRMERDVVLADGTRTTVDTTVLVDMQVKGATIKHWVRVLPAAAGTIIGMDVLRRAGMAITWAGDTDTLTSNQSVHERHEQNEQPVPEEIEDKETSKETPNSPKDVTDRKPTGEQVMSPEQEQALRAMLERQFQLCEQSPKGNTWVEHRIKLKHKEPIKQKYYPRNPKQQEIIDTHVKDMLEQGVIEKSNSPYSSPVVLVRKENGQYRFCIDFRKVNEASEKDAYPLPQIDDTLDKLKQAQFFSKLDLKNGYWNVPLEKSSRPVTAFTVPGRGLYHFKVMPFGLHSSGATFQRLLDRVIGPELEPHAYVYLDDIIVCSPTFEDHLDHLEVIFQRIRQAGLRINTAKCEFAKPEIEYLGHTVTREGIKMNEAKIRAINNLESPKNIKALRRLIGMTSWYRKFIPKYAEITAPLVKLLRKNEKFVWTQAQEDAVKTLKGILTTDPVLARADFTKHFTLQTDASDVGLGAFLTQVQDGLPRVIMYASRRLTSPESRYSVTERECLAVVWGIRKMRAFLEGYHFTVITDHQALKWLNTLRNPSGRLARWALELQQYQFDITYRSGKQNQVADELSRNPVCAAVEQNWYENKWEQVSKGVENSGQYRIKDGSLYKRHPKDSHDKYTDPESHWKRCIPIQERETIIRQNHDTPSAGHCGIAKTVKRVSQRNYWPGMQTDIVAYVNKCDACQKYKPSQQKQTGMMHINNASAPEK
jgi:hypothetical protein